MIIKSANAALREIEKWVAPEKASLIDSHYLLLLWFDLRIVRSHPKCCHGWSAGLGAAGGFPGERAGGAGAARLRPHLLLLELPLG